MVVSVYRLKPMGRDVCAEADGGTMRLAFFTSQASTVCRAVRVGRSWPDISLSDKADSNPSSTNRHIQRALLKNLSLPATA